MHCLAGSLFKALLSQEIFVTSVGNLKISPTVQMPFLENVLSGASYNYLIKSTFTAGYDLFITSSTSLI